MLLDELNLNFDEKVFLDYNKELILFIIKTLILEMEVVEKFYY